jgi:hypothetical protein
MKRKLLHLVCVLTLVMSLPTPVRAQGGDEDEGMAMIADTVLARPACFCATVVGSAFFVLSLPFSLVSKKVDRAAEVLVVAPARATFTRPLGEFSYP